MHLLEVIDGFPGEQLRSAIRRGDAFLADVRRGTVQHRAPAGARAATAAALIDELQLLA